MRIGAGILNDEALITIRSLHTDDVHPLRRILESTSVFTVEEVAIAVELMDIFLTDHNQQDYDIYTAMCDNAVVGYACVGPTPLTDGTFDVYWIAVDPQHQHRGIGRQLLSFAEQLVRTKGGRMLIAETSSQPKYENTRKFYLRQAYREVARIKEYYRKDDDLVIYGKNLSQ